MNDPERILYLRDAERFVTTFCGTSTSWSTPHLYISALATWPPKQPLTRLWKPRFMNVPLVQTRGIRNDLIVSKLVGSDIHSVAFSPDGSCIVSGSSDNTVRVWDATSGEVSFFIDSMCSAHLIQVISGEESPLWLVTDQGWVVKRYSPNKRLMMVPFPRYVVFDPCTTELVISRDGSASISFSCCTVGPGWAACYTPQSAH